MKIGIMGAKGSFSEKACEDYCVDEKFTGVEVVPQVSVRALLNEI